MFNERGDEMGEFLLTIHIKLSFLEQGTLQSPKEDEHGPATQFFGSFEADIKLISGYSGAHRSNDRGALLTHLEITINVVIMIYTIFEKEFFIPTILCCIELYLYVFVLGSFLSPKYHMAQPRGGSGQRVELSGKYTPFTTV